jgi:PAS domain S-box-containing protein
MMKIISYLIGFFATGGSVRMKAWKAFYNSTLSDLYGAVGTDQGKESNKWLLTAHSDDDDRNIPVDTSQLFFNQWALTSVGVSEMAAAHEFSASEPDIPVTRETESVSTPSPRKFETMLQQLDNGIALFDETGRLRFLNIQMARYLDMPRYALIGCTLRQLLFHPQLNREARKFCLELLKGMTRLRQFHREFHDAAGNVLLVSVTRSEELDGDYLVSVKDVSGYKQIEEVALQNDKLAVLGKIAAAIAHEIRNPLTSIRGFIQLLAPDLKKLGKQEYVSIILSEIDRANDIIYEFLNSSKPSAPLKQTVLVGLLLKELILLSESEANMRGCELNCEIFDPYLMVSIDVKQIKQVLLNMIKNAMDAIDEVKDDRKGLIEIIARREGDHAVFVIRDNGKGMDRQTLGKLFDPFFTTKESGTGLGLSVCERIISNHGGFIHVESQLNIGTEFSVYLPSSDGKE